MRKGGAQPSTRQPGRHQGKSPVRDHPPRRSRLDQHTQDRSQRHSKECEGRSESSYRHIPPHWSTDASRLQSCLVGSTTRLLPRTCPRLTFIGSSIAWMNPRKERGVSPRVARVGLAPGRGRLAVPAVGAAHHRGHPAETELTTLTSHKPGTPT